MDPLGGESELGQHAAAALASSREFAIAAACAVLALVSIARKPALPRLIDAFSLGSAMPSEGWRTSVSKRQQEGMQILSEGA
jgi:hypothetical protein